MNDFLKFSAKQRIVLGWWAMKEYRKYDAIICDGAVRSGKSSVMSLSFVMWAMSCFNECDFALCGKTITSLRRNVINPLVRTMKKMNMRAVEWVSKNYIDVTYGSHKNRFYIFGGKDEASASLIQGITLAGVLLDEAALLPRSFTEQAIARCSVSGSKLWFNCNPEGEYHWFKREWIDKADEKHTLYLTFTLDDNPSLTDEIKARYHRIYSGAFYERFVLGRWASVDGLVYPMFKKSRHTFKTPPEGISRYIISCDYGTVNPASFGLWGESGGVWYRLDEYYFDSRREGTRRTDEEHYLALEELAGDREIECVIADPSASSFIECVRRHKRYKAVPAKNDVLAGIGRVTEALSEGRIKISEKCLDTLREFSLYRWDDKGRDVPVKENDHAMDDIRYFVTYVWDRGREDSFFVLAVDR